MTDPFPGSTTPDRRALLRDALEALKKMEQKLAASEQARREPIAVIGIGCRLPGGITTPEEYWELLTEGRHAVTRMPRERWGAFVVSGDDPAIDGDLHAPFGGFLQDIDRFDAGFFGISRREAESMDPQQRLLLEVSWEALERAAIDAGTLRGSRTGVFVGVTTMDYSRLTLSQDPSDLDAYTATGGALNVVAGRLAYILGLNGPAMAIDTACSSSLVGVHLACQSLRSGETDLVLAGGVNAILLPEPFICFAKWGMMAPDGRCKTFDEAADGFVRGEGCAVLALKRLSDALTAGDPIWAVLRGSAVNQDGASSGLTVPNGRAQAAVISEALKTAGMSAGEIDYIEAHGTGTRLGDPIEIEAIINALGAGRTPDRPLLVGSVKTNIGHLESASGVAGLVKTILSLNHDAIPPHLHFKKLNPQIRIGQFPLQIPVRLTPWERGSRSRAAGVSSFGFSGTNAHVIVEEAPRRDTPEGALRKSEIVCLSARTSTALVRKARDMMDHAAGIAGGSLADISCVSTAGRRHFAHRAAFVAEDTRSLQRQLEDWLKEDRFAGARAGEIVEAQGRGVAFLFAGEGTEYAGMGRELYRTEPVFQKVVDRCAGLLGETAGRSVREIFSCEEARDAMDEPVDTRPVLFALEYALAETLREWGIKPSVVVGQGVGECVAACVAGVLSLEDGLKLVGAKPLPGAGKGQSGAPGSTLDEYLPVASQVVFSPPLIPFISCAEGRIAPCSTPLDAGYRRRYLAGEDRFADAVRLLSGKDCACWLEIGPQPALLSRTRDLGIDMPESLPTLTRGKPDWTQLTETLAVLYRRGWDIEWKAFQAGRSRSSVQLPTYPFEREEFWMAPKADATRPAAPTASPGGSGHPLLGSRLDLPGEAGVFVWQTALDMNRCAFLLDHRIQGSAVFPATAYIEMVLAAMTEREPAEVTILRDLSFQRPLDLTRGERRTLQLWMRKEPGGFYEVNVFSREITGNGTEQAGGAWTLHMTARAAGRRRDELDGDRERIDIFSVRSRCPEKIEGNVFYDNQKQRGNQWGPCFQGIKTLWRGNREALSEINVPSGLESELKNFRFHPAVADFCGHVLAASLPNDDTGRRSGAFVGGGISEVRVYASPVGRRLWSHARLSTDGETTDNILIGNVRTCDENGDLVAETIGARLWYLDGAVSPADVRDWLYEIVWVPDESEPASARNDLSGQTWIILSDEGGVGEALGEYVNAGGGTTVHVVRGDGYGREGESLWKIRPGSPEDFDRCLADVCTDLQPCSHVVHLWNLDTPDEMTAGQLQYWQTAGCGSALHTIQALSRTGWPGARIFIVTAGAQTNGVKPHPVSPVQACVWGMGRSAAIEHSQLWGGLIDLEPKAPAETSAALLLGAIASRQSEDQVMFRDGRRLVARLQPFRREDSGDSVPPIRPDGSYLVTGGLGGIGFETAVWLGSEGARHIAIIGRTPLPPRDAWDHADPTSPLGRRVERMRALEAAGASVTYFCGDVGDGHLFDLIRESLNNDSLPPIRGIVHASGVMQYEPLASQSIGRLVEVMHAKVMGGWLLHERFVDQPVDFFVMFSSSSSMLNSPFMAGYAAANAFLDALAGYRRQKGLQALSVSWGTWSETGMAVESARSLGAPRTLQKGVGTISNHKGIEALKLLLSWNALHAGVMPVDWAEWAAAYPAFASYPLFSEIMDSTGDSPAAVSADSGNRFVGAGESNGEKDSIGAYLLREVAVVLKTTPDRISAEVPLPTLGFDSLMAVELRTQIERDLGLTIPMVRFLEGPSVKQLAGILEGELAQGADVQGFASAVTGGKASGEPKGGSADADWEEGTL